MVVHGQLVEPAVCLSDLYDVFLLDIYWLLNVYCEIFGTSSYGEGRMSLRVRLLHMNECQIFYNIHSITFLLYTF